MKKTHIIITMIAFMLSIVTYTSPVLAQNTGQTEVSVGFIKDTEVKPDKPNVLPPTGGDHSGSSSQTPPHTTGRLPQTGELINYWLVFNGILLLIMLLFIFGLCREKNEDDDMYLI